MSSTYLNAMNFNYNDDTEKSRYNIIPDSLQAKKFHIPKDMERTTFVYISKPTDVYTGVVSEEVLK